MRCICFIIIILALLLTALPGCYYAVTDPQTGRTFFTDRWVAADGYSGPLTFTDHSGRNVSLRSSRVQRISKDEYLEATVPTPTSPPTPPETAPSETAPLPEPANPPK